MIFAYRQDDDQVELYVSERGRRAPAGFTSCTLDDFRQAWRLRDYLRMQQLRMRLENPYEARP